MKIQSTRPIEQQLKDMQIARDLIQRRLKFQFIQTVLPSISLYELRQIHQSIHPEHPPRSGITTTLEYLARRKGSFLYLSLFALLYQQNSRNDVRKGVDVEAIIGAWDFFCETFPGHIRETRPYPEIRPCNFNEAWVIAQSLRNGYAKLVWCRSCMADSLILTTGHMPLSCQVCSHDQKRQRIPSKTEGK